MQSQFVTDIINKCYPEDNELRRLLLRHSRDVADRALAIVKKHPELGLDAQFVEDCAMLHDIGIFKTDAPSIHCHGTEPYIRHGICGAAIVRAEGWPDYASVCERHTGAGISRRQVEEQRLPLPPHPSPKQGCKTSQAEYSGRWKRAETRTASCYHPKHV